MTPFTQDLVHFSKVSTESSAMSGTGIRDGPQTYEDCLRAIHTFVADIIEMHTPAPVPTTISTDFSGAGTAELAALFVEDHS
eukprot:2230620-Amphidinium_carterae.1